MKTKKTAVLLIVFFLSFLFHSCHSLYYAWDILCSHDYRVTKYIREKNFDEIRLLFDIYLSSLVISRSPPDKLGGEGHTYVTEVTIEASKGKFIKNIMINKVIVHVGENEYNMTENCIAKLIYEEIFLKSDNLDEIRRTGFIDFGTFTGNVPDNINDKDNSFYPNRIIIYFERVLPLYDRDKKIKIYYDFSAELTTGETINVKREIIARRKTYYYPWLSIP